MYRGSWHCTGGSVQDHARKRNDKSQNFCLRRPYKLAEKRREAKGKGEKQRYTHLNSEFQRKAKRDKKAFLGDQCKETEENNRTEKKILGESIILSTTNSIYLIALLYGLKEALCEELWKVSARWLSGKESACHARDVGLIPGSGRSSGEGNSNPLQYSCLGNPIDRGAWGATVPWVAKSGTWLIN